MSRNTRCEQSGVVQGKSSVSVVVAAVGCAVADQLVAAGCVAVLAMERVNGPTARFAVGAFDGALGGHSNTVLHFP